jgi:hypothetical protein
MRSPGRRHTSTVGTKPCSRLTFILGYDEKRRDSAVFFVKEVLAFPSTQRVMKAISTALLERGAIPGDENRDVAYAATKE